MKKTTSIIAGAIIILAMVVIGVLIYKNYSKNNPSSSASALIEEINVQKLVNGIDKNVAKTPNVIYDQKRNKVYASSGLGGSMLAIIDAKTDIVEEVVDTGVSGGIIDIGKDGILYMISSSDFCTKYDPDTKKAEKVQNMNECQSLFDDPQYGLARQKSWNGYTFSVENGWDSKKFGGFDPASTQDMNAAYNKIKLVYNGQVKGKIAHGPDAMSFDLDTKDGKIYTANTGDCSVSVFDLNKLSNTNFCRDDSCWIKDIDLGTTIDEILTDSSGNIYIRNRLGGSTIYKYNQATKEISLFADNENDLSKKKSIWNLNNWQGGGIGMWPSGFALSKDEKKMYVFSHFGASIDVIDTGTGKFLNKIKFSVPLKPRTDSLSVTTMDDAGNRMIGAWPELGMIGVADLSQNSAVNLIDLAQFGFDKSKEANKSLGRVKLAYNSESNKLYVYLADAKKLIALDGKTFAKENEMDITGNLNLPETPLLSNDAKGEIYLGSSIIDSSNFTLKSSLPSSNLIIEGFNNSDNLIYAGQISLDEKTLHQNSTLFKFVDGKVTGKLSTGGNNVIPAKYYFDFAKNTVYTYFMFEATIKKYDLQKMENCSNSSCVFSAPAAGGNTSPNGQPGGNPPSAQNGNASPSGNNQQAQGKCGDGVCDDFEKSSGMCPQDCH